MMNAGGDPGAHQHLPGRDVSGRVYRGAAGQVHGVANSMDLPPGVVGRVP